MFVSSPCCPLSCSSTQTAVPLVGIESDKCIDYIEEDTKTTVWLSLRRTARKRGRGRRRRNIIGRKKDEEEMKKIYVVT
jgi:hypothetical protein